MTFDQMVLEVGQRAASVWKLENLYAEPPTTHDDLSERLYGRVDLEDVIVSNMVLFHYRAKRRAS